MNPSETDHEPHPVLSELLDPETIDLALARVAPVYCAGRNDFLSAQKELFELYQITPGNARSFAQGIMVMMGLFGAVPVMLQQHSLTFAALLFVEAMRLSGDITDEQVETACRRFKNARRDEDPLTVAAMERMVAAFGGITTAPSRGVN